MSTNRRLEQSISRWLEQTAPARLPDRVLEATFERTRGSRQQAGWRGLAGRGRLARAVPLLGGAAVAVVAAVALGFGLFARQPSIAGPVPAPPASSPDPRSPFLGAWVATDVDDSTMKMAIEPVGIGALAIVVHDDLASVCSGAPSTMTGMGGLGQPTALVIRTPVLTCDDGSEPHALSGPPLDQQLRDLTFFLDLRAETLGDTLGSTWTREGAQLPRPEPTRAPTITWPQSSLAEVRAAQERADAGDPAFTWQVDPGLADWSDMDEIEILARFVREELGWGAFQTVGWEENGTRNPVIVRCAAGRTNPLYPDADEGSDCAPTIDDVHYERVSVGLHQPIRQDTTGIWVVTRWEMLEPFEQAVPPAEPVIRSLLSAFLQARIDGNGAEVYADVPDQTSPSLEVPLLYATTTGARYERFEFEIDEGPVWPDGWMRVKVRLFAEGGSTVVEQLLGLGRDDSGRLGLHYEYGTRDAAPTTEDGQAVSVQYDFAGGEVRFRAAWPWQRSTWEESLPRYMTLFTPHDDPDRYDARLAVVADPRPIGLRCKEGPAPADAAALARAVAADPDLLASEPIAVTLGGMQGLRMDVEAPSSNSYCQEWPGALVVTGAVVDETTRMRLYLLDFPGPFPKILAIALTGPKQDFERVMEAEAPLLDSFEFRAR